MFLQKKKKCITYDLVVIYTILESLMGEELRLERIREKEREMKRHEKSVEWNRYEILFSCLNLLKFERNGGKRKVEGWCRGLFFSYCALG